LGWFEILTASKQGLNIATVVDTENYGQHFYKSKLKEDSDVNRRKQGYRPPLE